MASPLVSGWGSLTVTRLVIGGEGQTWREAGSRAVVRTDDECPSESKATDAEAFVKIVRSFLDGFQDFGIP